MPLALHEKKFEAFFTLYLLLTNCWDLFSAACGQQKSEWSRGCIWSTLMNPCCT